MCSIDNCEGGDRRGGARQNRLAKRPAWRMSACIFVRFFAFPQASRLSARMSASMSHRTKIEIHVGDAVLVVFILAERQGIEGV